jgi:hypothetical protein
MAPNIRIHDIHNMLSDYLSVKEASLYSANLRVFALKLDDN